MGRNKEIETIIKNSSWWHQASAMPDRHYPPSAGISLADHLYAVHRNLYTLTSEAVLNNYVMQLLDALAQMGLDPKAVTELLSPVALLHDIGKPVEEKNTQAPHPLTGKLVSMRHPIVSLIAAFEILPETIPNRETILALIEAHDIPYGWYLQAQRAGTPPRRRSWSRLDRKIDPREDGTGIILLAVFKLADIDGHADVADVIWFIEQANGIYLAEKGRQLPLPDEDAVRAFEGG